MLSGLGHGGRLELQLGSGEFSEEANALPCDGLVASLLAVTIHKLQVLWQLLEGGKTAPGGHLEEAGQSLVDSRTQQYVLHFIQVCARSGCKYWCQLYDLDWLGPKRDASWLPCVAEFRSCGFAAS